MSYKIEVRKDERAYPVVVCDHCQKPIEKAEEGNTLWLEDCRRCRPNGIHYDPRHTHKACNRAYEHQHPAPDGHLWMWNGLDDHLFMLLLNTGYNAKKAKHTAQLLSQL